VLLYRSPWPGVQAIAVVAAADAGLPCVALGSLAFMQTQPESVVVLVNCVRISMTRDGAVALIETSPAFISARRMRAATVECAFGSVRRIVKWLSRLK